MIIDTGLVNIHLGLLYDALTVLLFLRWVRSMWVGCSMWHWLCQCPSDESDPRGWSALCDTDCVTVSQMSQIHVGGLPSSAGLSFTAMQLRPTFDTPLRPVDGLVTSSRPSSAMDARFDDEVLTPADRTGIRPEARSWPGMGCNVTIMIFLKMLIFLFFIIAWNGCYKI